MRRIWRGLVLAVVLVAGVCASGLALMGLLCSGAILRDPDTWYFPGEPPWADLALEILGLGFVVLAVAVGLRRTLGPLSRPMRYAATTVCAGLIFASLLPSSVMANRHLDDEWVAFRALAERELADMALVGEQHRSYAGGLVFRFSARQSAVRIRAVNATPRPTLVTDFGNGGTAHFDLRTMWCTYSD